MDNEKGIFEELVREKMHNHTIEVNPSDWATIQNRLHGKKKNRSVWYIAAASVAAAVLLVFFLQPSNPNANKQLTNTHIDIVVNVNENVAKTDNQNNIATNEPATITTQDKTVKASSTPKASNKVGNKIEKQVIEAPIPNENDINIAQNNTNNNVVEEENTNPTNDNITIADKEEIKVTKENSETEPKLYNDIPQELVKPKHDNNWLIAGLFSTGSGNSGVKNSDFSNIVPVQSVAMTTKSFSAAPRLGELIIIPNDATCDYSVPLSFSLMVRKNLNKRVGIETGLTYTYLSAKYTWNSSVTAKRQMHYIGIPVNFVFSIWNSNPNWELYAKAGGMGEKGIMMRTQKDDGVKKITETTSVKKLQWSASTSAGASYKLIKGAGIFVEPQLRYYFDSDQPNNIRTYQPLMFSVNAGLRYSF